MLSHNSCRHCGACDLCQPSDHTMKKAKKRHTWQSELDALSLWIHDYGEDVLASAYLGQRQGRKGVVLVSWGARSAVGVPVLFFDEAKVYAIAEDMPAE